MHCITHSLHWTPQMNIRTLRLTQPPLRLLAATFMLALAASVAQTAIAQPVGGPAGMRHAGEHGMMGHQGGPGMGMMGMGAPRMIERMLDAVKASPEQRAQIKQIAQAAQADLRAQRDAARTLHEQGQALFTQPTVDARAAEALRQQMLAQHDQASKRVLQAMLDVSRVLTPEQRKTLGERMAQRRSMMERHQSERESIDKAPR
jgi:periplasmic protein CpxP/Spy